MNLRKNWKKLKIREKVIFIPYHAHKDKSHPDCERGFVSEIGSNFVFVKFEGKVARFGWEDAPAEACDPKDLVKA